MEAEEIRDDLKALIGIGVVDEALIAAAVLHLGDRLINSLDAIESALCDINENLEKIWKGMPES
jgi:hypothetical protein